MGIRIFLAVWLSPELHERTAGFIEKLKPGSSGVKWSSKEQLHLTLKFLGEQPPAILEAMHAYLARIAEETPPFTLSLGEGGVFPPRGEPRILWVGLNDGVQPLSDLAAAVDHACTQCRIAKEERPFKAHLTIGRVKVSPPHFDREYLKKGIEGSMSVKEFAIVESKLSSAGPRYETLKLYNLNEG
jgi:2'-5' RNA ligase